MTHDPLPGVTRIDKLYLELLFRCNFSCTTCYHGADLLQPNTVTAAQVAAALDYFAERYGCRRVCLLGGEPLLHPDLPLILATARSLGYHTEICTNGYKRRAVLLACVPHLDLLRISLDGGTRDTHDAIRQRGSWDAAWETLATAADEGLAFGATSTLTGENIATIPALALRLRDLGARELTLHRVRPVGNAAASGVTEVTWEQTAWLHTELTEIDVGAMTINTDILLPERCAPPTSMVEKLEIAPDGRVYLSCAEVAGHGRDIRYDFAQATLIGAEAA